MADPNLADVQGFILRGYRMPLVRHFALRINDAAGSKQFLGRLVDGDTAAGTQITVASPWTAKPDYCLNIGLTHEGLKELQLSDASLCSFPPEFKAGSAASAGIVGDTGESAPENWIEGGTMSPASHMLLFLYAQDRDVLESKTAVLRSFFAEQGALAELSHHDGNALPDERVHFGYRDGISQPAIAGARRRSLPTRNPLPLWVNFSWAITISFRRRTAIPYPNLLRWGSTGASPLSACSGRMWVPSRIFCGRRPPRSA